MNIIIASYAKSVVDNYTLHGSLGEMHKSNTDAADRLWNASRKEFNIYGYSRMDRWESAITGFAKLGACAGAICSEIAMTPADYVFGQGVVEDEESYEKYVEKFTDSGVAGRALRFGTEAASVVGGLAGFIGGGVNGLLTAASRHGTDKKLDEYLWDSREEGAELGLKASANLVGGIGGAALVVARVPSLLFKKACSTLGGLAMGVVGFFVGGIRAITDV